MSNTANPFRRSNRSLRAKSTSATLRDYDGLMERLRANREHRDIEVDEMASRLGITSSELVKYEDGVSFPTLDLLVAYAGAVGVHIEISTSDVEEWRNRSEDTTPPISHKDMKELLMQHVSHDSGPRNWFSYTRDLLDAG